MYKRIDDVMDSEAIEGFSYKNGNGNIEKIALDMCCVRAEYADGVPNSMFLYDDIPNVIKALQAAYNHKKGI